MHQLTVNSRKVFRAFRNGANFATDTSVFSPFYKVNGLTRVKYYTNVTIQTFVLASSTFEVTFIQDTGQVKFIHGDPTFQWSSNLGKVGDTIRIKKGVLQGGETILNMSGNVLTTTDTIPVAAGLGLVDGTSYPDLEFYNITAPTSLVYQFGVVPNVLPPPSLTTAVPTFQSWIDGQAQSYYVNGIDTATPTWHGLTSTMTAGSEISEEIKVKWLSTTDDYIFNYEIEHIFRAPVYIAAYLTHFINQTKPFSFTTPNSYRYINQMQFGTNSSDPNEKRIFSDVELNGAEGFIGDNFTNGTGNYNIVSIAIEDDATGNPLAQLEATLVNKVTMQLENTAANFPAGQKAILKVMKLASAPETEFSNNTWNANHIFDECTAVDGGTAVDSDFIYDMTVAVNGVNPALLDVIFYVEYSAAQKALISTGMYYGIFCELGDDTLAAADSDEKVVWCSVNTFTKNTDIPGLITGQTIGCITAEKDPLAFPATTTDFKLWNGRLEMFLVEFNLTKFVGQNTSVEKLEVETVLRNGTTGEEGLLESFVLPVYVGMPMGAFAFGTAYQITNVTGYRNFDIKPDAIARRYTVKTKPPGVFGPQKWQVTFPVIIPDRTDVFNPTVPYSPFFDDTKPNNNQNYKTSNYYLPGSGWYIHVKLKVSVLTLGITTVYELYSDRSVVRDYDVDPPTTNWTCTTELLDENDIVVPHIDYNSVRKIRSTFSATGAGALTLANQIGEHVIIPKDRSALGWRLSSRRDWGYDGNPLEPVDGQTLVQVTQDVPGNKIILLSQIKPGSLDPTKQYMIDSHLYEDR